MLVNRRKRPSKFSRNPASCSRIKQIIEIVRTINVQTRFIGKSLYALVVLNFGSLIRFRVRDGNQISKTGYIGLTLDDELEEGLIMINRPMKSCFLTVATT